MSMFNMLMPVARQYSPVIEKYISDIMNTAQLQDGEAYSAIVATNTSQGVMFTLCAFTADDKAVRELKKMTFKELSSTLLSAQL